MLDITITISNETDSFWRFVRVKIWEADEFDSLTF